MKEKIFSWLIVFFVLFSLLPTFYELKNRDKLPPERSFELVHNYYTDYNFYLSRIRQGLEGHATVVEKYTSEPHQGSFIQVFYLWLGWVGRGVGVPWDRPGDVYHIARVVFGITLLAAVAHWAKKSFKSWGWQILAFLLAVTASTWPIVVKVTDGFRLGGYMPWWSVMDSLQRITFVPHLLAGQALTAILILTLSDDKVLKKPRNWIFLGILAFILGLIFPPGLLVVGVASGFLILFDRKILPRLIVGLLSASALIYLSLMVTIYPWKRLTEFDVLHPLVFNLKEYLLALGPVLPLGVLGLLVALIIKEKALRPAVAWILGIIVLFVGFHFVPQQSPLRFSEVMPQVPLAILTAYLFYWLSRQGKQFFPRGIQFGIWYLSFIIPIAIIAIGLGIMYSSWLWQRDFTDQKLRSSWPLVAHDNYIMYPLKDYVDAMVYLEVNTPRSAVVLSLPETGNYIPVYSGNTVYLGHANTVRAEDKEKIAKQFFAEELSPEVAFAWLSQSNIRYVLFGPWEAEVGGRPDLSKYTFLEKIYNNSQFIIYQIL